ILLDSDPATQPEAAITARAVRKATPNSTDGGARATSAHMITGDKAPKTMKRPEPHSTPAPPINQSDRSQALWVPSLPARKNAIFALFPSIAATGPLNNPTAVAVQAQTLSG